MFNNRKYLPSRRTYLLKYTLCLSIHTTWKDFEASSTPMRLGRVLTSRALTRGGLRSLLIRGGTAREANSCEYDSPITAWAWLSKARTKVFVPAVDVALEGLAVVSPGLLAVVADRCYFCGVAVALYRIGKLYQEARLSWPSCHSMEFERCVWVALLFAVGWSGGYALLWPSAADHGCTDSGKVLIYTPCHSMLKLTSCPSSV